MVFAHHADPGSDKCACGQRLAGDRPAVASCKRHMINPQSKYNRVAKHVGNIRKYTDQLAACPPSVPRKVTQPTTCCQQAPLTRLTLLMRPATCHLFRLLPHHAQHCSTYAGDTQPSVAGAAGTEQAWQQKHQSACPPEAGASAACKLVVTLTTCPWATRQCSSTWHWLLALQVLPGSGCLHLPQVP